MATTTQPATGETTKQLINYRTDAGVAVIEMADPRGVKLVSWSFLSTAPTS